MGYCTLLYAVQQSVARCHITIHHQHDHDPASPVLVGACVLAGIRSRLPYIYPHSFVRAVDNMSPSRETVDIIIIIV